jgi:hypothetical protein
MAVDVTITIPTLTLLHWAKGIKFQHIALLTRLPILYGSSSAYKGTADHGYIDAFETNIKGTGF